MPRSGNYNVNYRLELSIFRTIKQKIVLCAALVVLFAIPLVAGNYLIYLINFCFIAVIAVLGLNVVTGYAGQISLGQGALVAVGAYSTAIFANYGLPFWLVIPLAGGAATLIGLLVGLPSLRLEGLYLAITTLAFHMITLYAISHGGSFTGGHDGMKLAPPALGGFALDTPRKFYYLAAFLAVLFIFLAVNLVRSRVGRALVAIRDRDVVASALGINLASFKLMAFGISAFYAGVAGSLYGYLVNVVTPDHFGIDVSIQYLAMLISGGIGTIEGAVLGAFFLTLLPEAMRSVVNAFSDVAPTLGGSFLLLREGLYGLVIILFLIFEPRGLSGFWQRIRNSWGTYPYKYHG